MSSFCSPSCALSLSSLSSLSISFSFWPCLLLRSSLFPNEIRGVTWMLARLVVHRTRINGKNRTHMTAQTHIIFVAYLLCCLRYRQPPAPSFSALCVVTAFGVLALTTQVFCWNLPQPIDCLVPFCTFSGGVSQIVGSVRSPGCGCTSGIAHSVGAKALLPCAKRRLEEEVGLGCENSCAVESTSPESQGIA